MANKPMLAIGNREWGDIRKFVQQKSGHGAELALGSFGIANKFNVHVKRAAALKRFFGDWLFRSEPKASYGWP
jgi:hypothetical protein